MAEIIQTPFVTDEKQRIFQAWGSVEVRDKAGEMLPMEEFKKIMPIIMKRGGSLMDTHSNRKIGQILNYEFKEHPELHKEGVFLTCMVYNDYPTDDLVWDGIKQGQYTGLSFGGMRSKFDYKFEPGQEPTKILRGLEGYEFSVVEKPCNQPALMANVNMLAKSDTMETQTEKSGIQGQEVTPVAPDKEPLNEEESKLSDMSVIVKELKSLNETMKTYKINKSILKCLAKKK